MITIWQNTAIIFSEIKETQNASRVPMIPYEPAKQYPIEG